MSAPAASPVPAPGETLPMLGGRPLSAALYARLRQSGLAAEHVAEMCEAVNDGVTSVAEYWGLSPEVMRSIEEMALGFYRQRHMMHAALMYTFLVEADRNHATAWRGLGAACLAMGHLERAIIALHAGFLVSPKDPIVLFLLGESLLAARYGAQAKAALERALQMAGDDPAMLAYVKRARGMLAARDLTQVVPPPAAAASPQDAASAPRDGGQLPPEDRLPTPQEAARMTPADIDRHPPTRELAERLFEKVWRNHITLKEVAGFSDEQLVASYNAGCSQLEAGRPIRALEIAGWLQFYDSKNHLYYQLAGVAAQQMDLWCLADYMFGLALIYAPGDPTCLFYRGEVKIFSDEREAGVALVQEALAKLGQDPHGQGLRRRAQMLLAQAHKGDRQA